MADGLIGLQATVVSTDGSRAQGTVAPSAVSANDATVASYDRALPQLTPSRLVLVQADLYERLGELARGGLGKITRARDLRSGRIVAIKEIIGGAEDAAVRFAREAMITANLQHPAIVPVYEVGRWPDGQPFFAMKLVTGRPLNVVIDEAADLDARLALVSHVLTVADALAYAHGEKVIHRDLKPHNVLCGAHGETVVIDWGLARRLDEQDGTASVHRRISAAPGQTYVGAIMGTPAYMPPEQASGKRVDERADVYAIGAMLYHLLAGAPSYSARTIDELIEKVKAGPPRRIAEVVPEVPRDLAAIVERAMAPDPEVRYRTALELASDLRRFTTGQLVLAHRYTRGQRIRRFLARHRGAVTASAIALAALLVGGSLALAGIVGARDDAQLAQRRAESEQKRADSERQEVQRRLIAAHTDRARIELASEHPREALGFLTAAADIAGLDPTLRYLAARVLDQIPAGRRTPEVDLRTLEFVPGSHDLILGNATTFVRWNPETDVKSWEIPGTGGDVMTLDQHELLIPRGTSLLTVDLATGKQLREIASPSASPLNGMLGRDRSKRWIAGVTATGVELFDLQLGTHVASVPLGPTTQLPVVSPDGEHLVVGLPVSDVQTKIVLVDRAAHVIRELCGNCRILRHASSGIAIADYRQHQAGHVMLFDWTGKLLQEVVPASIVEVSELVQSPDGRYLAVFTGEGSLEVHDAKGLRWRHSITDRAYEALFDSRGRLWLLGAYNGVHVYDASSGVELSRWALGGLALRLSDDAQQVALVTLRVGVTTWKVGGDLIEAIAPSEERVRKLLFAGDRIVTSADDGAVWVYDPGKPPRELVRHKDRVASLQITPEGTVLSTSRTGGTLVNDIVTGVELERYPTGPRASASSDGVHLATGSLDGTVTLYDRRTKAARVLGKMTTEVSSARWSPDGTKLVAIDNVGTTIVWGVDGTKLKEVPASEVGVDLVFSNDSKWFGRIAQTDRDTLYSLVPGVADRPLEPAARIHSMEMSIAFAPGDQRVAIGDQGRVRVWNLESGEFETTISTGTEIIGLTFSPDGQLLYGGGVDRKIRAWDIPRGVAQAELSVVGEVYGLSFDPKRPRLAILTLGPAMIWNLPELTLDVPKLRAIVACLDERDAVTGAIHRVDIAGCNRLFGP